MANAGKWGEIGKYLSPITLDILHDSFEFPTMTPVQASTIPQFLSYKDVVVEACTGSGKTLAFVVPIFEMLLKAEEVLKQNQIFAIILTPTRELAWQIQQVFDPFLQKLAEVQPQKQYETQLLVGGYDMEDQAEKLKESGNQIIIATPGRLEHFFGLISSQSSMVMSKDGYILQVKHLEVLVLDEADRLLDMGFEKSINYILGRLPKQRRTGLFSATQTTEVDKLIRAGLRNPVRINVKVEHGKKDSQKTPKELDNFYTVLNSDQKLEELISFIQENSSKKIIVYFLTCACVNYFWKIIKECSPIKNLKILSLHGKVPHKNRLKIYSDFSKSKNGAVLLSTDVAARGIDIPDIDWIVQFDPPQDPDAFIHRVGRTARMGKSGKALLFILPEEDTYIEYLSIRQVPIQPREISHSPIGILDTVRGHMSRNREYLDRAQVAFVSYFRAYKEHHLSYIFRLKELNIGSLARSFALLQLPKMPELKQLPDIDFSPVEIDLETIPYLDKKKERQRQQKMKRTKEKYEKKKERELESDVNNNKKNEKETVSTPVEESEEEDDIEQLNKEIKLLKKLKKGKISEKEFAKEIGEADLSEEDEKKEDKEQSGTKDESGDKIEENKPEEKQEDTVKKVTKSVLNKYDIDVMRKKIKGQPKTGGSKKRTASSKKKVSTPSKKRKIIVKRKVSKKRKV